MTFGEREEMVFLGRSMSEHRNYSEAVARKIDEEVRKFIARAHERALDIMSTHREVLDELARQLMQKETLNEKEVEALLAGVAG
jgi:cell division protease FtsH